MNENEYKAILNLRKIWSSPCDYCCGYDYTNHKCKFFVCDPISRINAEERMKNE